MCIGNFQFHWLDLGPTLPIQSDYWCPELGPVYASASHLAFSLRRFHAHLSHVHNHLLAHKARDTEVAYFQDHQVCDGQQEKKTYAQVQKSLLHEVG